MRYQNLLLNLYYIYICIYIYIYIYITNLPVNAIVSLPHPRSGDIEKSHFV